jgi:deoxyribodipyrimidine photo-lyase
LLSDFLTDFPKLRRWKGTVSSVTGAIDWDRARKSLRAGYAVPEVEWCKPGERSARKVLREFLTKRLDDYAEARNDPTKNAQSGLSPFLHFGQLSAQRVAIEVVHSRATIAAQEAFLEELIVRRELSDNFCLYNHNYDSVDGFHAWARATLDDHRGDRRPFLYSLKQFEQAKTHDRLWNAAQLEMVQTGKMHGYLRMYWAKKILEWTSTPEEAMRIAIALNDRYELDGRDPNGYTGIAWSIGGVHDRAWQERDVFGKIRYMSYDGCRRKFDVDAYITAQTRGRQ